MRGSPEEEEEEEEDLFVFNDTVEGPRGTVEPDSQSQEWKLLCLTYTQCVTQRPGPPDALKRRMRVAGQTLEKSQGL